MRQKKKNVGYGNGFGSKFGNMAICKPNCEIEDILRTYWGHQICGIQYLPYWILSSADMQTFSNNWLLSQNWEVEHLGLF